MTRRGRKNLSDKIRMRMIELRAEGLNYREIAKSVGVGYDTVAHYLGPSGKAPGWKGGNPSEGRPKPPVKIKDTDKLYAGMVYEDIG